MATLERLNKVFRLVFEDDGINITKQTTADDIDGWDSLSHINLIVAVEVNFKVKFRQRELLAFKNVGDLVDNIEEKLQRTQAVKPALHGIE